jgi:uncharacterized protein YcfL
MGSSNKMFLILFALVLVSCKKNKELIFHKKLVLPSETHKTTKNFWDIYPVENLNIDDTVMVNKVSNFVLKNFNKNKVETCNTYKVSFYVYDENGENGINNNIDFNKDLIEWKNDYIQLEYNWIHGNFYGITYFDNNGGIVSMYVPVKGFEKHMKVLEREEKGKNGFDENGNSLKH